VSGAWLGARGRERELRAPGQRHAPVAEPGSAWESPGPPAHASCLSAEQGTSMGSEPAAGPDLKRPWPAVSRLRLRSWACGARCTWSDHLAPKRGPNVTLYRCPDIASAGDRLSAGPHHPRLLLLLLSTPREPLNSRAGMGGKPKRAGPRVGGWLLPCLLVTRQATGAMVYMADSVVVKWRICRLRLSRPSVELCGPALMDLRSRMDFSIPRTTVSRSKRQES